jgi:hypothetical protein
MRWDQRSEDKRGARGFAGVSAPSANVNLRARESPMRARSQMMVAAWTTSSQHPSMVPDPSATSRSKASRS